MRYVIFCAIDSRHCMATITECGYRGKIVKAGLSAGKVTADAVDKQRH